MAGSKVQFVSQASCGLLAAIFLLLAFGVGLDPVTLQAPHGLDFSATSPSGLAEIRAFYFGTLLTLGLVIGRGAVLDQQARDLSLRCSCLVLGSFVAARAFSYFIDGPPNNMHAHIMTVAEAAGSLAAGILMWFEGKGSTRKPSMFQTIAMLQKQEPLIPIGELVGLLFGWGFIAIGFDFETQAGVNGIVAFNSLRFLSSYGLTFLLFYRARLWRSTKFNPEYEDPSLLRKEIRRWAVSASISTALDVGLRLGGFVGLRGTSEETFLSAENITSYILIVGFIETHFYCVHRTLHQPWLYRWVHIIHHQSRNPNPFSGLSFHPIEACLYFSSLLLLAPFQLSALQYSLAKALLDFNPIWGHVGFGEPFGGSMHHYIHHKYGFRHNCNFGGTWLLDALTGTALTQVDSTALDKQKSKPL